MKKRSINLLLAALLVGALAACDDSDSILDPGSDPDIQTELGLSVDEDLTESMVSDAGAAIDAAVGVTPSAGYSSAVPGVAAGAEPDPEIIAQARELLQEARRLFAQAREAWRRGDTEEAARLAKQARMYVAEALYMVFGDRAIERLKERVDQIITWLEERVDERPSDLLDRIRELRDEAQGFLDEGLAIEAAERLLLAIQIAGRERIMHRGDQIAMHARVSFFMAQNSIELGLRLIGDNPTDEQVHVLRHAQLLLEDAGLALENGRFRRSLHMSREVVNLSLVAVMLDPDTDGNKVLWMIAVTDEVIAAAEDAVQSGEPNDFAERLLQHAKALQLRGTMIADTEPRKAVRILWYAATTAYAVIKIVTVS